MEFETKLSPEIIRQRLSAGTRPMNFINGLMKYRLLSKWNKDDTFYLFKTGSGIYESAALPFVGRIETRDGANYIIGKFTLSKASKIFFTCFFGFPWVYFFLDSLMNPNNNVSVKAIEFIAVWTLSGYLFVKVIPKLIQWKQQEEVVEYIRENLME